MAAPFRWDLVTPDQLGTLLDGLESPDLWFASDLADCAGKVLARSENSDLVFVGRSLDSMFDLLSGALSAVSDAPNLYRAPLSFAGGVSRLNLEELEAARKVLASVGASPYDLARRTRPLTFVDVVNRGGTFESLFYVLRDWIEEESESWPVIRTKLRFIGVTWRGKTSPNTWRWAQHSDWTNDLPAKSVVSVSLYGKVWSYLGNDQVKLTRTYAVQHWTSEPQEIERSVALRQALAEAVALVAHGRSLEGRRAISSGMKNEPGLKDSWLRTLQSRLLG